MSKQSKSDVGAAGQQGSKLGVLHVSSSSSIIKSRNSSNASVPIPDDSKAKGILVDIGGRVRTISDTTLNLLQHGSQLDITTHLMDKKLVGGCTSMKQLESAVAHARSEKKMRIDKSNGEAVRESSAERALEEALEKYGEEAEATAANRTISEILLQYSGKQDTSDDPPPADSPQIVDNPLPLRNPEEKRPPTPPISSSSKKESSSKEPNVKPPSQTSSRASSPGTERVHKRGRGSKDQSPNRFEILQQPFISRIQGGLIRTRYSSKTSLTSSASNPRRLGSQTRLLKNLSRISAGLSRSFSPVKPVSRRIGSRLSNPSPLRRHGSRHSVYKTSGKSSMETSRRAQDRSTNSKKSFPPGYGLALMPPPPSHISGGYLSDSYARRNLMNKPPVPRQPLKGASYHTRQSGTSPRHILSARHRRRSYHAFRGQRGKRSVSFASERPNRFFHGETITSEVLASRKKIKYAPEDPEYRTIIDPTYGRYRHFYMGMMERVPAGFPVNLRNVLFPMPPPPNAPSLMRYRNPLKIPLRKVGFEKDDFLTRAFPPNNPWNIRPIIPARVYSYKPPAAVPYYRPAGRDDNNNCKTGNQEDGVLVVDPPEENFWEVQEKRRAERVVWAERLREVVRVEREFVEAYKPYFRQEEEDEEYRQYDSNFEMGPRAVLMKLLEDHLDKAKLKSSTEEEEDDKRRANLKEPAYIPSLWQARLKPYRFITDNDYRWSLKVTEEGLYQRRRHVNWRECDLHDVYDMRCILEVFGLSDILPYIKYNRDHDFRSTTMGTVEFFKGSVYIKGFENILLAVVTDMTYGKADKRRLSRYFGRNSVERASVRQWLTYAMINIRGKSRLGVNIWMELESHLETHNFFATSYYSAADVLMYFSLYPFFKPLEREQRLKYPFVADFIRTIQRDENVLRANKRLMIRNWEDIHILKRPSQ